MADPKKILDVFNRCDIAIFTLEILDQSTPGRDSGIELVVKWQPYPIQALVLEMDIG